MPQSCELTPKGFRVIFNRHALADFLHALPDDHPLQIALRTYALALSFSLVPALLSLLTSRKLFVAGPRILTHVLKRELGVSGFASAMTVGVGGGAALKQLWDAWADDEATEPQDQLPEQRWSVQWKARSILRSLKGSHKTFVANIVSASLAILLLQSRKASRTSCSSSRHARRPPVTLDLTLLLLVRAVDALVRATFFSVKETPYPDGPEDRQGVQKARERGQRLTVRLDSLVFWACSARIMWCFFYEPERLPRSYNKWIMALANIDPRILAALRAIRTGDLCYVKGACTPPELVSSLSRDLGYPSAWGDISRIPAYGGPAANAAWQYLGVSNRTGLGGLPCELVHGSVTAGSCTANALIRGAQAFAEALAIYLPVHFVPILLTRPHKLLRPSHLINTLLSVLRSASFLSTFVSSIWISVCLTRTLFLARLFPSIPHDFWDGPHGCTLVGSLVCGASIWLEQGRRRGEMALYVLPRAVRSLLSERWLRTGRAVKLIERITFVLSLATLLTASSYRPDSLRGLSRWTLSFVMSGPNAGFWKRKRADTATSTPVPPSSPQESHDTIAALQRSHSEP